MKLSPETVKALRSLQVVNPRILIKPGKSLFSVSNSGKIIAVVRVTDEFPVECNIYDLPALNATLRVYADPEIEFHDRYLTIRGDEGLTTIWYAVSQNNRGVPVEDKIRKLVPLTTFHLKAAILKNMCDLARFQALPNIQFVGDGNRVVMRALNAALSTTNSIVSDIAETSAVFTLTFGADLFSFISGDHDVRIIGTGHALMMDPEDKYFYMFAAEKMEKPRA